MELASPIVNKELVTKIDTLPNFLAANIRLLRKRMGLSQQDLALRVGLNRGNIASYESGTAEPKICKLLRISNVFGVSTRDMTRLNLSDPGYLEQAFRSHAEAQAADRKRIDALAERLVEMEMIVESVKNLYNFRSKQLDVDHPDVKALSHYYEQMEEVAQKVLKEHQDLLNQLKCHCK
ncbi:MAG: helix-turn-helix transcriptional regulator [Bacteroidota bacterium]